MRAKASDQTIELMDGNQGLGPDFEAAMGQMVARLFEHWRLAPNDWATLLEQLVEPLGQLPPSKT